MSKCYASDLIAEAEKWLDYQEKKSNAKLDTKHENVGSNNYTCFGRDQGCNGQPWCLAFAQNMAVRAFGKDNAKRLLGGFTNYTPTGVQYFKQMKRYFKRGTITPKVGDYVFFYSSSMGRICHVGIVRKVDTKNHIVYTIEGNTTNNSKEFSRDGGCVAHKEYLFSNAKIDGYGRPDYDAKPKKPSISKKCNLYKSNTITKGSYGALVSNTAIDFIDDVGGGWSKIKACIGSKVYTGYVKNTCIKNKANLSKYKTGTIIEESVVVREKNKKGSTILTRLTKGTKVTVVSKGAFWVNVKFTQAGKSYDGFVFHTRIKVQ